MAEETKQDEVNERQATGQASQDQSTRARWRRRGSEGANAKDAGAPEAEAGDTATIADLKEQLAFEQAKADEFKQQVARAQADFVNYKRRMEQDREQQARLIAWTVVQDIVPILDNLDLTLANMPEAVRELSWAEGLLLVDRQLRATLEKQGLRPIDAVGTSFNPSLHEAIVHEESSEHADNEIIAELRRGYVLHDKVVRPTLVKVAKHVESAEQEQEGM
jgi:molecular chaperone GrpE